MEPSTAITARLCHAVQEDILKVVVDLPAEQARRVSDGLPKLPPQAFDTGGFECVVGGHEEVRCPTYVGTKLEIKGTHIRVPAPEKPARPLVPSCYVRAAAASASAAGAGAGEQPLHVEAAAAQPRAQSVPRTRA
eukprot:224163-Chlamydomonas_euryale.AAC.1